MQHTACPVPHATGNVSAFCTFQHATELELTKLVWLLTLSTGFLSSFTYYVTVIFSSFSKNWRALCFTIFSFLIFFSKYILACPSTYILETFPAWCGFSTNRSPAMPNFLKSPSKFGVFTLLLTKNSRTFQDPHNTFPGLFRSPAMFKYTDKQTITHSIYTV